jgi:outer membrane immunogenic protein
MRNFGSGRNLFVAGLAAVATIFGIGGAAADGPRPYAVGSSDLQGHADWSGFYIGGQLGGAWSSTDWNQTNPNYFNTLGATVLGTKSSFESSSAIGGIFGGGNVMLGHWVFGIEGEYNGVGLSDSRPSPFFPAIDTYSAKVDWLAALEGRVGYSWDNWLVYGRGGWAAGGIKMQLSSPAAGVTATKDTWADGWTIGGGAEYLFGRNIVLGLEYEYTKLDTHGETIACPACGTGVGLGTPIVSTDIGINSVMARASYLFMPED